MKNSFSLVLFVSVGVIVAFGVIRWLEIPAGTLVDWVTGLVAFWWLLVVTTVPWNMYFKAREILTDSRISVEKNISFNPADVRYASRIARIYLIVAVVLHLLSAGILYGMAYFGVSSIGYWASILALLLTFVRPLYRLHEYIVQRLSNIQQTILYPREDVFSLQDKVIYLESRMGTVEQDLNRNWDESWASTQEREVSYLSEEVSNFKVMFETLKVENTIEHQRLAKKSEESLAKLSEDAQFLNQVRELIRFVKNA